MSNALNFPKFSTPSTRTNSGRETIVLTQEEIDAVVPLLTACDTSFQRVKVLYARKWSVNDMSKILFHQNGSNMRPQMINQYIQKIRAGK